MVRQDVVQEFTVYDEDVVQVVQVVQVLCNQVTQLPSVFMPRVQGKMTGVNLDVCITN